MSEQNGTVVKCDWCEEAPATDEILLRDNERLGMWTPIELEGDGKTKTFHVCHRCLEEIRSFPYD